MRTAAKRDGNEREIIDALERIGALVQPLSAKDVPDLLVRFRGEWWLLEVKMPKEKLRPGQYQWHARFRGPRLIVVESAEDALRALLRGVQWQD